MHELDPEDLREDRAQPLDAFERKRRGNTLCENAASIVVQWL
jgi:hypothetical protein